jgi:hypothetical protein
MAISTSVERNEARSTRIEKIQARREESRRLQERKDWLRARALSMGNASRR